MKGRILLALCLLMGISTFAQEKMYIHKSDKMTLGVLISMTDSIYFNADGSQSFFQIGDSLLQLTTSEIDSITFGANSNTIYITYNGNEASVINPLAFEGVAVAVEGAYVTVISTTETKDINYNISGTTTNGMFKIYSEKRYNLLLNGVNITNPIGPAINVQSEKKTTVTLVGGTTNTLADGATYADPPLNGNGEEEDQDGTFFSEANLVFNGTGSLTITGHGSDQHGLCSDDVIDIEGGTITIVSASKDGIHANDGISISDGTINVNATGDGIDGDNVGVTITGGNITTTNSSDDVKGISCDSTLLVSGGILNLTVSGDQSKAMKSKYAIVLSGGSVTIHNSGDAVLEPSGSGYDPSYCTAIKCDGNVTINGADVTIVTSGLAGKGISSDTDIEISSGSVNVTSTGNGSTYVNPSGEADAYVSTCLSADGIINITGGTITTSSSGSGGKGFSSDSGLNIGTDSSSPVINVTTTGSPIYVSGTGNDANYAEAKTIKSDGAIVINNGNITVSSADDGIKSDTSIIINNATITINNSIEGLEAPFITINSGDVNIHSSDDCINTTFGNGGEQNDGSMMTFNGGFVAVNTTGGDGLDSNGDVTVNGGTIVVHGPPQAPEVGLDFNGVCNVNGGFMVVSAPNSNMVQAPSNSSTQYSVKVMTNQNLSATTLFHIQDASGNDVVTFQPARRYNSIVFSSSALQSGSTYSIYTGGTCTGNNNNGLYTGGTYSGGTFKKSFTVSNKVTNVNF
jgi:hypothetical protein